MEDLTFGIELEFLCVRNVDCFKNRFPFKQDQREGEVGSECFGAANAIFNHLVDAGIRADIGRTKFGVKETYSDWLIMTDFLQLSKEEALLKPEDFVIDQLELVSRKLSFHHDDWHKELRRVLKVLAQVEKRYGCKFLTNNSSGLHVHMGRDQGRLPFQTIKRVTQCMTAFESRLDEIHAASRVLAPAIPISPRIDNPFIENDSYKIPLYAPLSFFLHATGGGDRLVGKATIFDWLLKIQRFDDYNDVSAFYDFTYLGCELTGHRAAVNLDNTTQTLNDRGLEPSNTIEFRQHIGTLDYTEIVHYVTLLANMMQFCHTASHKHFLLLMIHAADMNFLLPQLLSAIGCSPSLIAYFQRNEEDDLGLLYSPLSLRRPSLTTEKLAQLATPLRAVFEEEILKQATSLEDLMAKNDEEQTINNDRATIDLRQRLKYETGYYGLRKNVAKLPFGMADVNWLLECALKEFRGLNVENVFSPEEQLDQAVTRVFEKLAEIYGGYDSRLPARQPALVRAIGDWEEQSKVVVERVLRTGRKACREAEARSSRGRKRRRASV
ncbi:hypothetical protein AC578_4577 [Pseudocercospora eumusae]|uniref:Uncharacterized protein n=1 Tax=Pseudocercospora eumusae TaxID=321146 RepID=A0A139H4E8_9PEZI|nr:hypothetical protein AC578_4577 [Pseudocercospora eumusae]